MLCATEETKKTLQMECEEAKFALKPWPIETTVIRQLDKNTCTCEENLTSDARAEEIAAEIGKTLLHSRQLRERLAANLYKERQHSRKPDLLEIYSSSSKPPRGKSTSEKENNARNDRAGRRSVSQQRPTDPAANDNNRKRTPRFRSVSTARSGRDAENGSVPSGRRPRVTSRVLEPSRDNVLARMTAYKPPKQQTNFLLANKMSLRSVKGAEGGRIQARSRVDLRKGDSAKPAVKTADKSTSMRTDEVDTLSELDRLIQQFSHEASANSSQLRSNCPIHAENAPSAIEERVTTSVDAVEGLDRFGVPQQLVKALKTYHAYVRAEVLLEEGPAASKKQRDAASNFMGNFERANKTSKLSNLSKHQDLLNGFSALYSESFKDDLDHHQLKVLKSKFIALESTYNECSIKSTAGEIKFLRSNSDELSNQISFDMKNWISNGVWNYLCVSDLKGIFGSHCTRYSDRTQLMLFFDLVQKIQRKVYETELIELLILTVIPKLKELFDPSSKEFIETYKMIVMAIQILNPKVPVLAKTDDD